MAIKHIEIQANNDILIKEADLDEIYIAMENNSLDPTSKVEGEINIGNYTPMVVDAIQKRFDVTINTTAASKEYLNIDPKDRILHKELSKYSGDGTGYLTLTDADKPTSLSVKLDDKEERNLDWIDFFTKVTTLPSMANYVTLKKLVYNGTKMLPTLNNARGAVEEIIAPNCNLNGIWNLKFASNLLRKLDISNAATNCTAMNQAFDGDTNLEEILLNGLQTSTPVSLYYTFRNCVKLKEIDLRLLSTNPTPVTVDIQYAFNSCSLLESIDLSNWNLGVTSNTTGTFAGCAKLQTLKALGCPKDTVSLLKAALNRSNLISTNLQHDDFTYTNSELFIKYSNLADHPNLEQIKKLGIGEQGISKVIAENTTTFPTALLAESDVWDFDKWLDILFPSIAFPTNSPKTIIYSGTKNLGSRFFNYGKVEHLVLHGVHINPYWFCTDAASIKSADFSNCVFTGTDASDFFRTNYGDLGPLTKVDFSGVDFSVLTDTSRFFNGRGRLQRRYMLRSNLRSLSKFYGTSSSKLIIGYLGTDKVGEDGTNWTYDSFDEENPDESLMAFYNANLIPAMNWAYGETEALNTIPTKSDYMFSLNSGIQTYVNWMRDTLGVNNATDANGITSISQSQLDILIQKCIDENNGILDFTGWFDVFKADPPEFWGNNVVTDINITRLCTYPAYMFYNCRNLKSIKGIGDIDMTGKSYAFAGAPGEHGWGAMFLYCTSLPSLDLSGWKDVSKCRFEPNNLSFFRGCNSLLKVNLSNWKLGKNQNIAGLNGIANGAGFFDTTGGNTSTIKYIYAINCDINTLSIFFKNIPSKATSTKLIIGNLGEEGWEYCSYSEEDPDESLMAIYDQALYDYMVREYGETDALNKVPTKDDYIEAHK